MHDSNSTQKNRSAANFPPEVGKLAIISNSTSGLGFEIALGLAQAGADVVLTGRNAAEGHDALARIRQLAPNTLARYEKLDLESQTSVTDFALRRTRIGRPVDLLINYASTLALLRRQVTRDRFELHLGTNYLAHFSLTARLLPLLRQSKQPRVVQVTSAGRHHGEIHLDDLQLERNYTPLKAYSQSKLAMLIFAIELQRQSDAHGWGLLASAAQPLGARAAHIANATEVKGSFRWYRRALGLVPQQLGGALQALLTRTETESEQDSSNGKGLADLIGPPAPEALDMRVLDSAMGRILWEVSTHLTKVEWPTL